MTRLAMRVYVFICNAPRCEQSTGNIAPPNPDDGARSAWRVARSLGWTRAEPDAHLCPAHRLTVSPSHRLTDKCNGGCGPRT